MKQYSINLSLFAHTHMHTGQGQISFIAVSSTGKQRLISNVTGSLVWYRKEGRASQVVTQDVRNNTAIIAYLSLMCVCVFCNEGYLCFKFLELALLWAFPLLGMFAGFGYLSLYLAGKLHCFSAEGRSQSWRLITVLTPLISAAVVGISRIQDNMHHWEGKYNQNTHTHLYTSQW